MFLAEYMIPFATINTLITVIVAEGYELGKTSIFYIIM